MIFNENIQELKQTAKLIETRMKHLEDYEKSQQNINYTAGNICQAVSTNMHNVHEPQLT